MSNNIRKSITGDDYPEDARFSGFLHINALDTFDLTELDLVKSELQYAEGSNSVALHIMAARMRGLARRFDAAAKKMEAGNH